MLLVFLYTKNPFQKILAKENMRGFYHLFNTCCYYFLACLYPPVSLLWFFWDVLWNWEGKAPDSLWQECNNMVCKTICSKGWQNCCLLCKGHTIPRHFCHTTIEIEGTWQRHPFIVLGWSVSASEICFSIGVLLFDLQHQAVLQSQPNETNCRASLLIAELCCCVL